MNLPIDQRNTLMHIKSNAKRLTQAIAIPMLLLSSLSFAQNDNILVMDDAKVFAEFNDNLPFVTNYFSPSSEEDILAFYLTAYGEPINQERKRGRLTSHYYYNEQDIRVVISTQNKLQQVDILLNK